MGCIARSEWRPCFLLLLPVGGSTGWNDWAGMGDCPAGLHRSEYDGLGKQCGLFADSRRLHHQQRHSIDRPIDSARCARAGSFNRARKARCSARSDRTRLVSSWKRLAAALNSQRGASCANMATASMMGRRSNTGGRFVAPVGALATRRSARFTFGAIVG